MTDPVEQAARALAGNPARAEQQARALIVRNPADPRVRLILASALRRLDRAAEALPLLADLAKAWPRAARTRYEYGLCLCAAGQARDGAAQLDEAVRLDPDLADAWQAMADMAFADGDPLRERRALAALARIGAGHPELGRAAELVALGRHREAEPLLRRWLMARPRDAAAARLLAQCYVAFRAFDNAETLLRHALAVDPASSGARFDLAHALFARQQAADALKELAPLLAADPRNPAWRNLQAGCLALLGDDIGAEAIHAELAAAFPANARIAINHGHALRTTGERERAIAAYRHAATLCPQAGEAWWSLANLKVGALTDADEAAMRGLLAGNLPDAERMHLEYALGRRCEDAGRAGDAFARYAAGAALARRHFGGAGRDWAAQAQATADLFTPAFLAARKGWGAQSDAPIFVVGLPRSGSTLVEQILASHPDIEGTMELPYIGALAGRIEAAGGADALAAATPEQVRAWGEEYLERAAVHRRLGRKWFIDKMPNNFRHIGLIRLILPHARIVDVRRHPMASGFSCYKQLFAEGQEFSYDLADLAAYYRHYLAIVRHFGKAAPGTVHNLIYEDLVDHTEAEVRRLLAAVGAGFDPACLRFFANDRAVRTVSSEQVRQPIYRSGLDQWRAFESFLAPLAAGLGPEREGWRA
ncbi:sulfotransferase [Novosphingobium sp. KCTC 2891]|uniref:tetratricopeptide repeat-containing sulfotransferase family protein n=1 Tax=Novosphingobium sp. KCTC 2891 TaxID=2989730 RepID=UPI00222397AD|nr:tetratricopeptide repeat-containing sulfotransferase family protein [Novosphingobium sp. KCTC 2891]MCW1381401.1 sulfotransferase [Novosphingobium sp. KCTC 2891]